MKKIDLEVDYSLGVIHIDDIDGLPLETTMKDQMKSSISKHVGFILSLYCCNPMFIFIPMAFICVLSFPFMCMYNLTIGFVFFGMVPGSIVLLFISLTLRSCLYKRRLGTVRREIFLFSKGTCDVSCHFKFSGTEQNHLESTGHCVVLSLDIERFREYELKQRQKHSQQIYPSNINMGCPGQSSYNNNWDPSQNQMHIQRDQDPIYPSLDEQGSTNTRNHLI